MTRVEPDITPRFRELPSWLVAIGDHVAFQLGVVAVALARFRINPPERGIQEYLEAAPILSLALIGSFLAFDLYSQPRMSPRVALLRLVRPLLLTGLFAVLVAFLVRGIAFPRMVIAIGCPLGCLFVLLWRVGLNRWGAARRGVERVLLVVDRDAVSMTDQVATLGRLVENNDGQIDLAHIVDFRCTAQIVREGADMDLVIIASAVPANQRSELSIALLEHEIRVLVMPAPFDVVLATSRSTHFHDVEGIELSPNAVHPTTDTFKRGFDFVAAAGALLILWPIAVAVGLAVRLDSAGPALFRQRRVGKDGRIFFVHKFRTMANDAEVDSGPVFASAGDARITRVGRLLRRSRLDEIPQFWNVLVGDMSLVGPRPERPEFVEQFALDVPAYRRRHRVRPGISGLAQVRAGYSATAEEKLRFDLLYVNRMNLLLDLRILVQTFATIIDFSAAEGVTVSTQDIESMLRDRSGDEVLDRRSGIDRRDARSEQPISTQFGPTR